MQILYTVVIVDDEVKCCRYYNYSYVVIAIENGVDKNRDEVADVDGHSYTKEAEDCW